MRHLVESSRRPRATVRGETTLTKTAKPVKRKPFSPSKKAARKNTKLHRPKVPASLVIEFEMRLSVEFDTEDLDSREIQEILQFFKQR